ncbi:MAG: orotate phosphoribosyltransferase [Candidatus Omnitrophica bacterium]|nr:orotate phosphoribosyltransferase [Candidatus Omnitrophota bacterium]MCM8806741.1 orotate phosphoribosyltransferase [Candidatus Omnitrophota bacterium]
MEEIKEKLKRIIIEKGIFFKEVILSSGKKSDFYIDCRIITLSGEGLYLVSKIIFEMIKDENVDAIGGLTLGADPIVSGVSLISYLEGKPIYGFIVRSQTKEHGMGKLIEGNIREGWKVAIVDDVATTGSSLIKAIEAVEKYRCIVKKVICIVDREEGAKEALEKKGYKLESIFTKSILLDFLK